MAREATCITRPSNALHTRALSERMRRDSLAILAEMYHTAVYWSKGFLAQEVSFAEKDKTERKQKPFWACWRNGHPSKRVWKIFKMCAAAGSAYGHFFLHQWHKKSSRNALQDEISLACAIKPGVISGDAFAMKALCTDVFHDADLKLETLLRGAEAGSSLAQLEIADLCATPLHVTSTYLPPHHVAHCLAVTRYGA